MSFRVILLVGECLLRMFDTILVHFLLEEAETHVGKQHVEDL